MLHYFIIVRNSQTEFYRWVFLHWEIKMLWKEYLTVSSKNLRREAWLFTKFLHSLVTIMKYYIFGLNINRGRWARGEGYDYNLKHGLSKLFSSIKEEFFYQTISNLLVHVPPNISIFQTVITLNASKCFKCIYK